MGSMKYGKSIEFLTTTRRQTLHVRYVFTFDMRRSNMLYYRAKTFAYDYFNDYPLIKGELLTKKERNSKCRHLHDSCFEEVRINKNKTFVIFGVRFEKRETKE